MTMRGDRATLLVFSMVLACGILPQAARADADDGGDWPMYHHDVRGTRHNTRERRLSRATVPHLRQLWSFTAAAPVTGTPVTAGDDLYVGDWAGNFYALDQRDGRVDWTATTLAPISASALVDGARVLFGDQAGFLYGLDRESGALRWQLKPISPPLAAGFSSPTPVGRDAASQPGYPCCSFRGSVVLLEPLDGRVIWQTYLVSEAERAAGSSGAGVWTSPTYDEELGLIYVATGNNYSAPATGNSDAVIALDARTGAIRFSTQCVPSDVSNFTFPIEPDKDSDFGDSPQVYRLESGRKVIGAGDKNGIYFVFDAATGEVLGENQVQPGGSLGGLFADSAVADGVVFANGANWPNPFDFSVLPVAGILTAISGDARSILWQSTTSNMVNLSGVAVANGVVYVASCNPGTGDRLVSSGAIFALDERTGAQLAAVPTNACASSGPSVAHGRVFAGLGNELLFAGNPPGAVIALGL
jgi:polyvinyl alcohol dehydrogenase (cytochrome)